MKILVVGSSGFISRAVIRNLANKGHDVWGLDRHPHPLLGMSFCKKGDILDRQLVFDLVDVCDGVINLAGILGTSELANQVLDAVRINIEGGVNLFDAVRKFDKPAVQITVGNKSWLSVYPITKVCAENLALLYNKDLGTRIAVVRAMNAYGSWQKAAPVKKLIPNLIRWAMLREPARIYGDGDQILDPIYVEDVAEVLVRALLNPHGVYNTIFEAGTGQRITVNAVADLVWQMVAGEIGVSPKIHEPMRPGEPDHSVTVADISTLAPLGSVPMLSLELGMAKTVAWYLQRPEFLGI